MNRNVLNIVAVFFVLVVYITACSDAGNDTSDPGNAKSDTNDIEEEFITKLNADDDRMLCAGVGAILDVEFVQTNDGEQYFINANGMGFKSTEKGEKSILMLVAKEYLEQQPTNFKYQFQMRDAYKLTEKGRKYFIWGEQTCLGDRAATSVVEYTEPAEMMGKTVTEVSFKYDTKVNDLASDLGLEEMILSAVDGKALFIKTNKGWRLEKGW